MKKSENSAVNKTLRIYQKLVRYPFGNYLFSKVVCRTAPYFSSIYPLITDLRVNHCECIIQKRKRVFNHIKTVHVIAICNGLEMAMGVMAEASVPKHLRWIPKGMTVEYTAKAGSDIRCVAKMSAEQWQPGEQSVQVEAFDDNQVVVVKGLIKLWISEKPTR
jgi:acyl-coenzyme A thioesterase PaaI-like protein